MRNCHARFEKVKIKTPQAEIQINQGVTRFCGQIVQCSNNGIFA